MASSGKRKTTRAKLTRESKLLEKRAAKEARKFARKEASSTADSDSIQYSDDTYFGPLAEDRRPV
ncbi:MAG: hypothetical protein QOG63_119 [Thermoleophilaceae bacterium]|jgi:hypothetical protein|nr:hypothetical protein [Thermoleophilaceae bacterium]